MEDFSQSAHAYLVSPSPRLNSGGKRDSTDTLYYLYRLEKLLVLSTGAKRGSRKDTENLLPYLNHNKIRDKHI